ncbi:zinc finger, CCHC-type containing protein [Tanacetum coccineum]
MFIYNAVMTIDKSWTSIPNRNSDAFLDGLFAFIKRCEPLLHPITQKIRCPCSRCCNRDDKPVTLDILEAHLSNHGFDKHYTTWKYHGEPLPLPPPVPHSPEHIDMDAFFEDISANNVPTPPTQTTGPQPAQTTGPNNDRGGKESSAAAECVGRQNPRGVKSELIGFPSGSVARSR